MSTHVMAQCWPIVGISPAQKAVLISLADQANDQGVCWPSVRTISVRTCLSERSVRRAIKELVDAGLIAVRERRGTSSVYQITPDRVSPPTEMHPCQSVTPPLSECHPNRKGTIKEP